MAQWKQFSQCHESKQCCGLCKVAKISAGCICQTAACWPKTVCGRDRVHYKSAPQSLNISTWKQQMCNKSMWHRLTIQLTPFSFIKRDTITQKSNEAQLLPPDPCWPKKKLLSKLWLGDVLPFSDVQTSHLFSSAVTRETSENRTGWLHTSTIWGNRCCCFSCLWPLHKKHFWHTTAIKPHRSSQPEETNKP